MASYLTAKNIGDAKEIVEMLKEQGKASYYKRQKDGSYHVYIRGLDQSINLGQEKQREEKRARQIKYTDIGGKEEYVDRPKRNLEDYSVEDFDKIVAKDVIEATKPRPRTKAKTKKVETEPKEQKPPRDVRPGEYTIQFDTKEEVRNAAKRANALGAKDVMFDKDNLGRWSLYYFADDPEGIESKLKLPPTQEEVEAGWRKESEEKRRKRDIEEEVFKEAPETIEAREKSELEKMQIRERVREKVKKPRFLTSGQAKDRFISGFITAPAKAKKVMTKLTSEELKGMTDVATSKRRVDVVGSQIQGVKGIKSGKHPLIGNGFGNVDDETGKPEQPKTRISQYKGNPKITEMGISGNKGFADLSGLGKLSGKKENNPNEVDVYMEDL